ncbi:MAG: dTMP kinase [bacterium]
MGKIIAIDGTDSSGKRTQVEILYNRLLSEGNKVKKIEFPSYGNKGCSLVEMYLEGDFGKNAEDVNPYVASMFYAMDRFASMKTAEWLSFYQDGGIIITDRYTTSNMIHQASKINTKKERKKYLEWLYDLEYVKCGLPIPDITFFLNMPSKASFKLMDKRGRKKDIHENDKEHLRKAYQNALWIAQHYQWNIVNCANSEKIKSINDIHKEIYRQLQEKLQGGIKNDNQI